MKIHIVNLWYYSRNSCILQIVVPAPPYEPIQPSYYAQAATSWPSCLKRCIQQQCPWLKASCPQSAVVSHVNGFRVLPLVFRNALEAWFVSKKIGIDRCARSQMACQLWCFLTISSGQSRERIRDILCGSKLYWARWDFQSCLEVFSVSNNIETDCPTWRRQLWLTSSESRVNPTHQLAELYWLNQNHLPVGYTPLLDIDCAPQEASLGSREVRQQETVWSGWSCCSQIM